MRVVIASGGIAALEGLAALPALAGERVQLTLLAPATPAWRTPPRRYIVEVAHFRREATMVLRRLLLLFAGSTLAAAFAPTPAVAASHTVRVLDGHSRVVAVWHSAKCRKHRHDFKALTAKTASGYSLFASIDDFSGFHSYELLQSGNADPYVTVHGPGGVSYSNLNVPPFSSFGYGGLDFRKHGKLLGIGYSPAYSAGGSDAVTFTGVLTCKYPRKRRR
jgi:hypothetical protein